jgi:hypothetical protein
VSTDEGKSLLTGILSLRPHVHSCTITDFPACSPAPRKRSAVSRDVWGWPTPEPVLALGQPRTTIQTSATDRCRRLDSGARDSNRDIWKGGLEETHGINAIRLADGDRSVVLRKPLGCCSAMVVVRKLPEQEVPFWDAVVAPSMGCKSMAVESWIHGPGRLHNNCGVDGCVVNAAGVSFSSRNWTVMQDHSKWALCCDKTVVCMGDMNREHAQQFRGGMAACIAPVHGFGGNGASGRLYAWMCEHTLLERSLCLQCQCDPSGAM